MNKIKKSFKIIIECEIEAEDLFDIEMNEALQTLRGYGSAEIVDISIVEKEQEDVI